MKSIGSGAMTAWAPGAWASSSEAASYGRSRPPLDQPPLERAPRERVPFGGEALLDLAVRAAVAPEDETAGVAERARVPGSAGGRVSRRGRRHPRTLSLMSSGWASGWTVEASDSPLPRRPGSRRAIWPRKKTAAATIEAMAAWMIRLPGARVDIREFKAEHVAPASAVFPDCLRHDRAAQALGDTGRLADRQRNVSGHVSAEVA